MLGFRRGIAPVIAVLALCAGAPAAAQENLDQGKSAAQLFASDCAVCHKTTNGLAKGAGILGLKAFLREHYTASVESAAALAAYVNATDKGSPAAKRKDAGKRKPNSEAKADTADKKADSKIEKKPRSGKATATTSGDAKATETKETNKESRPRAKKSAKPAQAKAGDVAPGAKSDSSADKASEGQASDPKPSDGKADGAPDEKKKSD
jgi:hypothetical protein